jgi:hypothetical protein
MTETPLWRRMTQAWRRAIPRPRRELLDALEAFNAREVRIVCRGGRWGPGETLEGLLDTTPIGKGYVVVACDRAVLLPMIFSIEDVADASSRRGPF